LPAALASSESDMTGTIRKRLLDETDIHRPLAVGEIDIAEAAVIAYSSEHPGHPIEHLIDGSSGRSATRWVSARADAIEQIVIEFGTPQSISRLIYEVQEAEQSRTQEVRLEVSTDGGQTYRQVLVQEYTFSPRGAIFQREDLRLDLKQVSHLRLIVVPNKNGSGMATLSNLQLFH
jgi:hypothetical protein